MSRPAPMQLSRTDLDELRRFRLLPNLTKIPLFLGLMVWLTWVAWNSTSAWTLVPVYIALGYLWMGMVTFMHDALHYTLFRRKAANWAFGILCMLPIFATFVGFREDHIEHHKFNRSPRDPDAFTMGKRGFADFLLFYAYALIGGVLSFIHFNFIYPFQRFGPRLWAIQLFELALKTTVYWLVLSWAAEQGMLGKALEVWLYPVLVLSLLNSMRFIAEHYGAPWDAGQMAGTRTVISNPVNSFFWNNINWHIGHHVYPTVPWYNLQKLHRLLEPQIVASGAPVDKSYIAVYWDALRRGPESPEQLAEALASRKPAAPVGAAGVPSV
ncbi:MAG TPA: fatty acid desaturase [Steroidobacteraceae bacterium]|nr:fatty acid desaturase [Steroidobacteraceae bacterium]